MPRYLIAYVVMLALFPLLDAAWIGWVARGVYQGEIGGLLSPRPNVAAAAAFYALYAAGVLLFAVAPEFHSAAAWRGIALAGAFGLVAYGTYDLTNLATLRGFTLRFGLIDMAWGVAMTTAVAGLAGLAARRFS
jgi:uncharacterized membrane protein